ncbi:hypothetical protein [Candidatus Lokiarchaeum ossiferum]|uniref:hypothetical protein n=1 Tax=Candidatus Lokiarchaeum ossiferum TaxID=2951803 RepID=UPI00352C7A4B
MSRKFTIWDFREIVGSICLIIVSAIAIVTYIIWPDMYFDLGNSKIWVLIGAIFVLLYMIYALVSQIKKMKKRRGNTEE